MGTWHPWRELGIRHPDVTVSTAYQLPPNVRAMWRGTAIWLCRSLTQAERRSALTHELQHLARGLVDRPWREREERIVDELAARQLIPLPDLLRALRWSRDDYELAEELWTDIHTVRVRRLTLTDEEIAWIDQHLDGAETGC